jgi:hypothetical protein
MHAIHGHARFTLGAAALLALAAGCSHEAPPPQSTPSFESRVTPAPVMTAMPPPAEVAPTPAPIDSTPPPMAAEPTPPAAPPQNQANERQLCDEIGHDAKIAVVDVPGGIAVTATPKGGASLGSVQRDAKRIEEGMSQVSTGAPDKAMGESKDTCVLFDVGRQGGRLVVTEAAKSVKLTITTADATQVKAVRSQVREFVKTLAGNTVSESKGALQHDDASKFKPGANDPGDVGNGNRGDDKTGGKDNTPQKSGQP